MNESKKETPPGLESVAAYRIPPRYSDDRSGVFHQSNNQLSATRPRDKHRGSVWYRFHAAQTSIKRIVEAAELLVALAVWQILFLLFVHSVAV